MLKDVLNWAFPYLAKYPVMFSIYLLIRLALRFTMGRKQRQKILTSLGIHKPEFFFKKLGKWLGLNHLISVKQKAGVKYAIYTFSDDRDAISLSREPFVYELLSKLSDDAIFIDVGANIGMFTIYALNRIRNGKVIAIEPFPDNIRLIRKSIELNHFKNAFLYECALSDKNGMVNLYLYEHDGLHSIMGGIHSYTQTQSQGFISVQLRTLDSIVNELGLHKIDLIKIDVEGAELLVLKGASDSLPKINSLIMDIHSRSQKSNGICICPLCSFLRQTGFKVRIIRDSDDHSVYAIRS